MSLLDNPELGTLIILTGILFFTLAYKRPLWAVAGILLCLPSYLIRATFGGLPFNVLDVLVWTTFFGVAFHIGFKFSWHSWFYPCLLFVAAGVVGVLVAPSLWEALGQFKSVVLEPVIVFVLLINVMKTEEDRELILNSLILSGGVLALVTIVQYFWGYGIPDPWQLITARRATAWFGYPNAVGLYLAPIFGLALGKSIFSRISHHWSWWLSALTAALIPGAVWASHTDGAAMAIVASILVFGLFTKQRWWWVVGGALSLGLALAMPATREALLLQDVSGDVRRALWEGTWRLLQARPLTGTGLAGFPYWYDLYRNASHVELLLYAHNMFLDFWLQMTVLGLLAWGWIELRFFYLLKPVKRVFKDPILLACAASMVGLLVYGLVDVPYFKNDLAVLFWAIVGLAVISHKWTNHQKNARLK